MDSSELKHSSYGSELNFNKLVSIFYNYKKLIVITTIICTVLSIIYIYFLATPRFEANSEALVNVPTEISTNYGIYTFFNNTSNDYIQYALSDEVLARVNKKLKITSTIDALKSRIRITSEPESSRFKITTSGVTSEDARMLNDLLIEQFDRSTRVKMKIHALNDFVGRCESQVITIQTDIANKKKILAESMKLLDSLKPIYTLQKALFSDPKTAAIFSNQFDLDISTLSENVMVEEFANENYFILEEKITTLSMEVIALNQTLAQVNLDLENLKREKLDAESKYNTENEYAILNNVLDVYAGQFIVMSSATTPQAPISPRKGLSILIGVLLGLMIGTLIAFVKEYWGEV